MPSLRDPVEPVKGTNRDEQSFNDIFRNVTRSRPSWDRFYASNRTSTPIIVLQVVRWLAKHR